MRYNSNGTLSRCYRKWSSMIQRCTNPKHPAFSYYGGSGVKVAERWLNFDAFAQDMSEPPEGYWLDRIDNGKGYEPGNCRWVTPKESAANRRSKGGPKKQPDSLAGKARAAGLPYQVVIQRVRAGWTEERALNTPKATRQV